MLRSGREKDLLCLPLLYTKQAVEEIFIILFQLRRNGLRIDISCAHKRLRDAVQDPRRESPSAKGLIAHDPGEDIWLNHQQECQGRFVNGDARLCGAVNTDGIGGVRLERHIKIRIAAVTPCQDLKDPAFCRLDCTHTAIGSHLCSKLFRRYIIQEQPERF